MILPKSAALDISQYGKYNGMQISSFLTRKERLWLNHERTMGQVFLQQDFDRASERIIDSYNGADVSAAKKKAGTDLWHYCTSRHCRDMILSFYLLGENDWPEDRIMSCLYALSNHGERHYKRIPIAKRDGTVRTLLAPDPLLKYVQKNILHHVLEGLSVSGCAMAYRKQPSSGIVCNAAKHVKKPLILKLDIKDFFGSIPFKMVLSRAFPVQYFPLEVGVLLTSLCCYGEYLPQGAPTSPMISNLVMKPFDEFMADWCSGQNISYSRYCDDMTFSGDFDVRKVRRRAEGFLHSMGFELNPDKTRVLPQSSRQTVTGLVVNDRVQVTALYRRNLRQEVHYCRRFGVKEHLLRSGKAERFLFPDGTVDCRRYLQVLLGKVQYVRLTRPEDAWFLKAEEWLKEAGYRYS